MKLTSTSNCIVKDEVIGYAASSPNDGCIQESKKVINTCVIYISLGS